METIDSIRERFAALPSVEVDRREDAVRSASSALVDALVVTTPANIRWLTGFTGSAGIVLVTDDDIMLITDGRYTEQAAEQLARSGSGARLEISSTGQAEIAARFVGDRRRIGLEADHVTWSAQRRYGDQWFARSELVPTSGLIERLRRSKDPAELARIELAAMIADASLATHRCALLDGPTELEFARSLDATMIELGASGTSFETIVASGPNGAMPHARPTDRRIGSGDLVVIDMGCIVDGYCSDMTRTLAVGPIDEVQERMLATVTSAKASGVAAVRAGAEGSTVDGAARSVIDDAGWGSAFSHGTGHGVGLDIHESPRLGSTSSDVLVVGDVVTVEPGVYLPGHGGVRIEDLVVVTDDGCRVLTGTPVSPIP